MFGDSSVGDPQQPRGEEERHRLRQGQVERGEERVVRHAVAAGILPDHHVGIVLEGAVTLTVGGQVSLVPAGHSLYYSSLIPHAWTNKEKDRTVVVWVVSPPTW